VSDAIVDCLAAAVGAEHVLAEPALTASYEHDWTGRFAGRADVGQVAVNLPTSGGDTHIPFGGFRDSGSAFREQGTDALRVYTRTKTVAIRYAP